MRIDSPVTLTTDRVTASIVPNRGAQGGFSLVIDGTTQSHVNPEAPRDLQLDYVRAIAALIDTAFPVIRPVNAMHLGGGALTVPRYVAATRADSWQRVVELHGELLDFVLENLPLTRGPAIDLVVGDARAVVERCAPMERCAWNLIVVDVFSGSIAPRHVSTAEFYAIVDEVLTPDGVVIVNTLTSQGLDFTYDAIATLSSRFSHVVAIAPQEVTDGERVGNVVLAASHRPLDANGLRAHTASWPRPARVFTEQELATLARRGAVRHDEPARQAAG